MTPALRLQQLDEDLRAVLRTASGRRLLWSLIEERAGAVGVSFSPELAVMAYREGRRSVGLELMQDCQRLASPDYLHMLAEAVSERDQDRLEREQHGGRSDDSDG